MGRAGRFRRNAAADGAGRGSRCCCGMRLRTGYPRHLRGQGRVRGGHRLRRDAPGGAGRVTRARFRPARSRSPPRAWTDRLPIMSRAHPPSTVGRWRGAVRAPVSWGDPSSFHGPIHRDGRGRGRRGSVLPGRSSAGMTIDVLPAVRGGIAAARAACHRRERLRSAAETGAKRIRVRKPGTAPGTRTWSARTPCSVSILVSAATASPAMPRRRTLGRI